jgi:AcrR family transcriptional regulator
MPRTPTPPSLPHGAGSPGQLLDAARECFARRGVRATTMEAVARTAGTTRQTLYRHFAGKRQLVAAAVARRVGELADDIGRESWETVPAARAFVERAATVVAAIRADGELAVLLGSGSPLSLHEALWQPELRRRGLAEWSSWMRRARQDGVVRGDVLDEDVYDWLQVVLTSMVLRPDPDPARDRLMIEGFLLRSLGPAHAPSPL